MRLAAHAVLVALAASRGAVPARAEQRPVPRVLRDAHVIAYDYYDSSPAAAAGERPAEPAALPLAVVLAHREFFMGCHGFERFLSARWETLFVYEAEFARAWRLADTARAARTRGAHVLQLDRPTGEWLARVVALRLLRELGRLPPLLLSAQCDIQPLPGWHAMHVPFEAMAERWAASFLAEAAARAHPRAPSTLSAVPTATDAAKLRRRITLPEHCFDALRTPARPLLVMNTVLLETLPDSLSLEGAQFHAVDVGRWVKHSEGGRRPRGPLPAVREAGDAREWTSDISFWVEDHSTLYNATLLAPLAEAMARAGATVSEGVRALPAYMCEHGLSAVRHNELAQFYDRAWRALASAPGGDPARGPPRPLFRAEPYATPGLEWVRAANLRLLSREASPAGCMREFMGVRAHVGAEVNVGCAFATVHMQPEHLPDVRAAPPDEAAAMLAQLLALRGLEQLAPGSRTFWLSPFFHTCETKVLRARGADAAAAEQGGGAGANGSFAELRTPAAAKELLVLDGPPGTREARRASGMRWRSLREALSRRARGARSLARALAAEHMTLRVAPDGVPVRLGYPFHPHQRGHVYRQSPAAGRALSKSICALVALVFDDARPAATRGLQQSAADGGLPVGVRATLERFRPLCSDGRPLVGSLRAIGPTGAAGGGGVGAGRGPQAPATVRDVH